MNWLEGIYEVVGSSYPRLSIAVAAVIGAIVFGGGWWLIGRQYTKEHSAPATIAVTHRELSTAETDVRQPTLLPPQGRLLELLVKYQQRFAASKLVVSRTDGQLFFDDDSQRGADVSLIRDLYGVVDLRNAGRFEELMQNMPSEYVRLSGEGRLDNPFIVSVTEAGVKYLETRR